MDGGEREGDAETGGFVLGIVELSITATGHSCTCSSLFYWFQHLDKHIFSWAVKLCACMCVLHGSSWDNHMPPHPGLIHFYRHHIHIIPPVNVLILTLAVIKIMYYTASDPNSWFLCFAFRKISWKLQHKCHANMVTCFLPNWLSFTLAFS